MRKIACTLTLLALAVSASPAAAQTKVPTRASLDACHTGGGTLERFALFSAQMGAVPGTSSMQIRFDLLSRGSGPSFRRVKAPGLGVWRASAPGIDIFRYRKQVAGLQAPGAYRALVRFRWLNEAGKVIQSAARKTSTCKQPDLRSDLVLGAVTAERGGEPGRARYTVVVRNAGRVPTPSSFAVTLSVGTQTQPTQTVDALGASGERELVFVGPRCGPTTPLRVALDSDLAVDEANESNNVRTVPCPL